MQTHTHDQYALNAQQSRRLATLCARVSRHTFEIAEAYAAAFQRECPGCQSMSAMTSNGARHEFAWNVAEVVKSLGDLRRVAPMLEYAGRTMAQSGWTQREWAVARRCLLSAIGGKCEHWNAEAESDFGAAIDACFTLMGANSSGAAQAARPTRHNAQRKAA